jgi:hypothetical protein
LARRRYGKPSPAVSTAGQTAQPRDPAGDESLAADLEPRSEYGKPPPESASEPVTGLRDQLAEQRRYAQYHALHQYIASNFPGALPHEADWLMKNPHHLSNPMLVHQAAKIAADRGIPRQDPQFLQFVGQLLDQHAAAQMQPAAAPAPPPAMPPLPPPVATHIEAESHDSEPESEPMPSHHVSAPVSRSDSGHSIEPELSASTIRLTPAQREIANLPGGPGEVEYAKQLMKMNKLKRAKVIRDE